MGDYYFIESKLNGNVIDISGSSTAPGALLDAYPRKTSENDNQLWEFTPDPGGSGYYFIKSKLNGNAIDIQGGSIVPGAALDAYPQKTSGSDNQLWQFVEDPDGSGYCFIMSRYYGYVIDITDASRAAGAQLDAYPQKPSGTDNQLWRVVGGKFPSTVKTVRTPTGGLVSNGNYYLEDHDKPLTGVSVEVLFLADFASSANGYSFQLNCYSMEGENISTEWQQFVIYAGPGSTQLTARIDTWASPAQSDELNRIDVPLANLPTPTIPAGYDLYMLLGFDSSNGPGTIREAVYQVADNNTGKVLGNTAITIVGHTLRTTGQPATVENLAPIAAFQFNIGGDYGRHEATLNECWGTIGYSANNILHVSSTEPGYTDFDDGTAESANLIFGPLPETPNQLIRQWFQATTAGEPRRRAFRLRDELGRPRHFLQPPDALSLGRQKS
jgi:hypothetical protein